MSWALTGYLGFSSGREGRLRAKLALLVTAAVVFAPGWDASDAVARAPAGGELGGRILAPTFDEASASPEADRRRERLERARFRGVSSKAFGWQGPASGLPQLEHFWIAVAAAVLLASIVGARSTRSPRAPPHLLTV